MRMERVLVGSSLRSRGRIGINVRAQMVFEREAREFK